MGFHKRYIGIEQVKSQLKSSGYRGLYKYITGADAIISQDDASSFVVTICTCDASKDEKLMMLDEFCQLQFNDVVEC
jgi:hypothetical protein